MLDLPIYYFWLMAVITGVIGILSLLTWCLLRSILTRSMREDMKNNKSIVIKSKKDGKDEVNKVLTEKSRKTKTLQNVLRLLGPIMIASYIVALISMFVYAGFASYAKKYGAYDAFEKVETINTIRNLPNTSFIDQSNKVPTGDDRLGIIIVFYKYNCPDCIKTHDMILEALQQFPDAQVYFVSSRSEVGKQLVAEFGVQEVPSAVYIREPDLEHTVESFGPYTFWYKDFFQRKSNGDAVVDAEGHNMYQVDDFILLLTLQQETNQLITQQQYYIEHPEEAPTYPDETGYDNYDDIANGYNGNTEQTTEGSSGQ